jgi:hypothetical protein
MTNIRVKSAPQFGQSLDHFSEFTAALFHCQWIASHAQQQIYIVNGWTYSSFCTCLSLLQSFYKLPGSSPHKKIGHIFQILTYSFTSSTRKEQT